MRIGVWHMDELKSGKLIMAVMQKDDYENAVEELNRRSIFVTKLSSSGGFLKKENITILIGVPDDKLEDTLNVLKTSAGRRKTTVYTQAASAPGVFGSGVSTTIPVEMETGGVTVFIMNMQEFHKF